MNKQDTEFFKQTEQWFASITDKSEEGLRSYLRGESPADAGESLTQKVSSRSALLIYDCDSEALRFKLLQKFAELAVFDRREIKHLKKNLGLNDVQAEAVRFANLMILRNEYIREGIETFEKFVTTSLSAMFKTIDKEVVSQTLKEFRKTSRQAKTTLVEGIGLSYVERLKQNASLFTKNPNVGRPRDVENKMEEIRSAIEEVFRASFGKINGSNIEDILSGKISAPRITKIKVARELNISRPQFDEWLVRSKLDFEEQVEQVQDKFYQELKKLRTNRNSN